MIVVGSLIVGQKIHPFIFDSIANKLTLDEYSWERAIPLNSFDEVKLWHKIRQATSIQVDEIRIGKYFCTSCQKWLNANNQEWSYGICLSCSLDRDSDFSESLSD